MLNVNVLLSFCIFQLYLRNSKQSLYTDVPQQFALKRIAFKTFYSYVHNKLHIWCIMTAVVQRWPVKNVSIYSNYKFQAATSALRDRIPLPTLIRSESAVRVRDPDPDDFQNLLDTSVSRAHLCYSFHEELISFCWRLSRIVEKCPISQCWIILQFLYTDLDADDFQKFNQFFLVYRYISGQIFMKIWSVVFHVKLIMGKQKDRKTDKRR